MDFDLLLGQVDTFSLLAHLSPVQVGLVLLPRGVGEVGILCRVQGQAESALE